MSPRPRRDERRTNLRDAIKESAWRGIATDGASSLSLRAIARDLGITAPAIYHYFSDRDALVTELVIDAFTSFGDWQLAAWKDATGAELVVQLAAIGDAYRRWALAFPQRYELLFGTPLPGYRRPDAVRPAGSRSLAALVGVVEAVRAAGRLVADGFPPVQPEFVAAFAASAGGGTVHALSLSVAIYIWTRVHGLVALELAGHLAPFGADPAALYHYELRSLMRQLVRPAESAAESHDLASSKGVA